MIPTNYKIKFLLAAIFAFSIIFGFTTTVFADDTDQPNYGDPITIDGNISDWDLTLDHYAVMYRNNAGVVAEADAYLRFDHSSGILNILVLSRSGQTVRTINEQYVSVDEPNIQDVNQSYPAYGDLPHFAFVNSNGTYAEGWEAAVRWADVIDPEETSHQIFIHALLFYNNENIKAWVNLPINIYRWDFGDLPESYGTTFDPTSDQFGPVHSVGRLRLGTQVDGEANGQPSGSPILDDLNGRNDEDGVIPISNWRNATPTIEYTVNGCTGNCYLSAWIDWGAFDSGSNSWQPDGTFDVISDTLFINRSVINGTGTITFTIPSGVGFAATFNTRFRLCDNVDDCTTPWATSETEAPFGEVEDYQWSFDPNAVTINSFTAVPTQNTTIAFALTGSVAAILFVGLITIIKKRKNQGSYL